MTWEKARELFLKQKAEGLDALMIGFEKEFYVTDRPSHLIKCKEIGHTEATQIAIKNCLHLLY